MSTQREAVVVRIEGDEAILNVSRLSGCGRCNEPGGCGGSGMDQHAAALHSEYRAPNTIGARAGETVSVSVPDGGPLFAALFAYMIPLGGLLLGALLADLAGGGDPWVAAAGISGAAAGYLLSLRIVRRDRARRALNLEIARPGCQAFAGSDRSSHA